MQSNINIILILLLVIEHYKPLICRPLAPTVPTLSLAAVPLGFLLLRPEMRVDHLLEAVVPLALLDLEVELADHLLLRLGLAGLLGGRVLLDLELGLAGAGDAVPLLVGEAGVSAHGRPDHPPAVVGLELGQAGANALQAELLLGGQAAPVLED